ncbi:MAG: hypothetical protein ABI670_04790 [Chloroflexota bacterium]
MALPEMPYNFHDAGLVQIAVGPRKELTLVVRLDDPHYPPRQKVTIRFGGITNLPEISAFIEQVPPIISEASYMARVDHLDYDAYEPSKQQSLNFRLELDMVGKLLIRCRNVTIEGEESSE